MASDPAFAFRTYADYLEAIRLATELTYTPERFEGGRRVLHRDDASVLRAIADRVGESAGYQRLRQRPTKNPAALRDSLINAWTTEHLLFLSGSLIPRDGIGAATNWSVVQAYYVLYQATRALHLALGADEPLRGHAAVRRTWLAHWSGSSRIFQPWSLGFGTDGVVNPPRAVRVTAIVPSSEGVSPATCWDYIGQALRTTRNVTLKERLKDARRDKAKERTKDWRERAEEQLKRGRKEPKAPPKKTILTPDEKLKVDRELRTFTFVDLMYRLRIRSNYEDMTMWTEGSPSSTASAQVHADIEILASASLLLHELFIRRAIGEQTFEELAEEWLRQTGGSPTKLGLDVRRRLLV